MPIRDPAGRLPFLLEPLDVEHLLSFLFGKHSTHGAAALIMDGRFWPRYRKKVVDHVQKYVRANVVPTDSVHETQLDLALCDLAITARQGQEPFMTAAFARLCLVLLGSMPNHWHRKRINRPEHFRLDRHRSVHHSQTPEQKARLIADTCAHPDERKFTDASVEATRDQYDRVSLRRGAHAEFVAWFRDHYPAKYVEIFG